MEAADALGSAGVDEDETIEAKAFVAEDAVEATDGPPNSEDGWLDVEFVLVAENREGGGRAPSLNPPSDEVVANGLPAKKLDLLAAVDCQ